MRKISLFWEIYFWIVFLGFITLLGVVLIGDFNFFENPFTKTYEVFFAIITENKKIQISFEK